MKIFVTGGAGFIGSALVLHLVNDLGHEVLNVDAMTYAAIRHHWHRLQIIRSIVWSKPIFAMRRACAR